jgi:exoribonuclease R
MKIANYNANSYSDYYYLDEDNYQIIGRRYGNIYRLGDNVKVMVNKVDLLKKQMEFRFTE